jgi:hypothetical protein
VALSVLAAVLTASAGAQSATGMDAMRYYVGTWSCVGGAAGLPQVRATQTYVLDSGVLRLWTSVPVQGKMKKPYHSSEATTYDEKNGRYVLTLLNSGADWTVSVAKPWTGNIERWTDIASNDGKFGHSEQVRTDDNTYSYLAFPTLTSTQPYFRMTCKRS